MKFIIVMSLLLYCCSCENLSGKVGTSSSIDVSKERNVFVKEIFFDSIIQVNDSIFLNIEHCWIERNWYFGKNQEESVAMDSFKLLMQLKNKDLIKRLKESISIKSSDLVENFSFGTVGDNVLCISNINELSSLNFTVVEGKNIVHNKGQLKDRYLGSFSLKDYKYEIDRVCDSINNSEIN